MVFMTNLFEFLKQNDGKSFSAQELRQRGLNVSRTELRMYHRKGLLSKTEAFLHNTIKKNLDGSTQMGTKVYKYGLI
jgi:hypothetical protein